MAIEWLRAYVEKLLGEAFTEVPVMDGDGDYPLRYGTAACWVRLCEHPYLRVDVFAHAAIGVKQSARLLREINDMTAGMIRGRIFVRGGVVVVEDSLAAPAVTTEELVRSCTCVGTVANDLGALLAAMFDGQTPFPVAESIESGGT